MLCCVRFSLFVVGCWFVFCVVLCVMCCFVLVYVCVYPSPTVGSGGVYAFVYSDVGISHRCVCLWSVWVCVGVCGCVGVLLCGVFVLRGTCVVCVFVRVVPLCVMCGRVCVCGCLCSLHTVYRRETRCT